MANNIEDEVTYYYDFHPTKEDLMGESALHRMLVTYLMEVIQWLFQGQVCAVYGNLNFYQSAYPKEYPLAPAQPDGRLRLAIDRKGSEACYLKQTFGKCW